MYRLGNGDGTFGGAVTVTTNFAGGVRQVYLVDLNNDGNLDSITSRYNGFNVKVNLGNGDGTFAADANYSSGGLRVDELAFGDVDNDGDIDMFAGGAVSFDLGAMWLNQGDGTFGAATNLSTDGDVTDIETADLNNDGNLDLIFRPSFRNDVQVRLGNGSGGFTGSITVYSGTMGPDISLGDFNNDGIVDLIVEDSNNAQVLFGDGDGTFTAGNSYVIADNSGEVAVTDIDGDGFLDFIAPTFSGVLKTYYGDGTGDFTEGPDSSLPAGGNEIQLGDSNGDGVLDAYVRNSGATQIFALTQGAEISPTAQQVSLLTPFSAQSSLDVTSATLDTLSLYQAQIGASMSRLATAFQNSQALVGNLAQAESQIRDADMAVEAAKLVRLQILQQAGSAVLAQANQQPNLALLLLES